MAELIYYHGTMNSGKSTLALQTAYNNNARGRQGIIFTQNDRAGSGKLSSRLGLEAEAVEVLIDTDLHAVVIEYFESGKKIEYVICDEAQFYSPAQVEQLAQIVDGLGIDVFAFGILTDFRTKLFPGSQRLVELANKVQTLQVEALCFCGARATHNARTVNGIMVTQGEQVYIGDTEGSVDGQIVDVVVAYEVLCRKHHLGKRTAKSS